MKMTDRVTCQSCRNIIDAAPKNEHGHEMLDQIREVGALAEIAMGHAMMFTNDGRTALCITRQRTAAA